MSKQCVIVTGGSRGIGLATALRFARRGVGVVITARDEAGLQAAAREIAAAGGECEAVAADVTRAADAQRVVQAAEQRFGGVDVLVNNVGMAPVRSIVEMSEEEYRQTLAANLDAPFHMTRAAWAALSARRGVIVNVSSLAALDPFPGFAVYGACKAWVSTVTKVAADEGRKAGIRVFAIAPGAVETQMLRSAFPKMPADKCLAPDDVAAAIEGLCDERWTHSSGQTIAVRK